jgi:hypothetical protein
VPCSPTDLLVTGLLEPVELVDDDSRHDQAHWHGAEASDVGVRDVAEASLGTVGSGPVRDGRTGARFPRTEESGDF